MFTTGMQIYLYISAGLYILALIFIFSKYRRTGLSVLCLGFILNFLYLLGRGWLAGVFIPIPIFEKYFFLPWCLVLIAIIRGAINDDRSMKIIIVLSLVLLSAPLIYKIGIIPPTPKKTAFLAGAFFMTEGMAHALFFCCALFALIAFIRGDNEDSFHSYVVWGFVIYSISQVVGAAWCYIGWGNTFRWSTRHMDSAAVWLLFASCLHLKYIPSWTNRKKSFFVFCCGAVVVCVCVGSFLHELDQIRIGG